MSRRAARPAAPRARRSVAAATLAAAAAVAIVLVAGLEIVGHPAWSAAEVGVVAAAGAGHDTVLDVIAETIAVVFGSGGAVLVALLVLGWMLLLDRTWRTPLRGAIVLVTPWIVVEVVKQVVRRPRPEAAALTRPPPVAAVGFSFPSGHTAFAAAVCCAVALAITGARVRGAAIAVGVVVVLATAWSRVYLGVHYPTDVTASLLLVPAIAVAAHRLTGLVPTLARDGPAERSTNP